MRVGVQTKDSRNVGKAAAKAAQRARLRAGGGETEKSSRGTSRSNDESAEQTAWVAVGAGASRAKHRLVEKSWTGMELGRRLTGGNLSIIFAGGARVLPLASEPEQGAAPYIQGKHLCR